MILISLLLGMLANQSPAEVVRIFNAGWGYAVGEFALVLIPSFTLAAVSPLLIIGAASAFAGFLTLVAPFETMFTAQQGAAALVVLFLLSAGFKILQGSSMSVFAAVGPIALPIVAASQLPPALAVIALCLGSFIAILPNDSFYWLIRKSALAAESEWNATKILAAGSTLQAVTGFAVLMGFYVWG